jgi:hypothetical protein
MSYLSLFIFIYKCSNAPPTIYTLCFPLLSFLTCSAPVVLSSPHGLQFSSCRRPKQLLLYNTCEACPLKCRRHWRRHHPVAAEPLGATSLQSMAHSMDLVSSSHPGFCSQCYHPWQSPRYQTCDKCRLSCRRKYHSRLIPTTATEGVSLQPSVNAKSGFPRLVSSTANVRRQLRPLPRPHTKRQGIIDAQSPDDSLDKAVGILRAEYERQAAGTQSFPQK